VTVCIFCCDGKVHKKKKYRCWGWKIQKMLIRSWKKCFIIQLRWLMHYVDLHASQQRSAFWILVLVQYTILLIEKCFLKNRKMLLEYTWCLKHCIDLLEIGVLWRNHTYAEFRMLSHCVIFFKIKPRVHQDLPNVENVLFLDVTHWTLVPNVENASTRGTHNSVCMWKNNQKFVCVCVCLLCLGEKLT